MQHGIKKEIIQSKYPIGPPISNPLKIEENMNSGKYMIVNVLFGILMNLPMLIHCKNKILANHAIPTTHHHFIYHFIVLCKSILDYLHAFMLFASAKLVGIKKIHNKIRYIQINALIYLHLFLKLEAI